MVSEDFSVSENQAAENADLIFEGINYRANIWLNGRQIAATNETYGAFRIFKLDVSGELKPGGNIVAVEIFPPQPGDFTMGFVDWNPKPADHEMGLFRPVKLHFYRGVALAKIWGDGTFVDFEHSLNAAMNRLRQSLGDSAEKPRYIETIPGTRIPIHWSHGASGRRDCSCNGGIRDSRRASETEPGPWVGACRGPRGLVSLAVWWRFHDAGTGLPSGKVIRLTNDSGLSDSPALSPDGKLLAYSSDRAKEGEMDLYVKQVAGGAADPPDI